MESDAGFEDAISDLFSIETRIERMKKQIQDSRKNGRSTGGGAGRGGRGGRGGGLGGG